MQSVISLVQECQTASFKTKDYLLDMTILSELKSNVKQTYFLTKGHPSGASGLSQVERRFAVAVAVVTSLDQQRRSGDSTAFCVGRRTDQGGM